MVTAPEGALVLGVLIIDREGNMREAGRGLSKETQINTIFTRITGTPDP